MLQRFILRCLGYVPTRVRLAIIGHADQPSTIANFVHWLLNLLASEDTQVYSCHGALEGFRMATEWARYRAFVYGNWEPVITQAMISHVKCGMCVFDVGAHLGYYSLLAAKCVGPCGKVVAFEPSAKNFSLLRKNIELNKLTYVRLVNQAVFCRPERVTLSLPLDNESSGNWSINADKGGERIHVQADTIDRFCHRNQIMPDFLKIDVEGAEYDVLMGAVESIQRYRPKLLIELHHFDGNLRAHPVPDLLQSWGYKLCWLEKWKQTSHIFANP
jgi:FkbM family methyltransferase